ncbi:hypothetical protein [Methylicorpusculum sp.]|uniref:hypothetical protein n=1 Tax=Methylicorpusculum sp. TaxID=2713644 RepID=UPI002ABC55A7|nr:hypothetical protein [Methylicorpusculum sp.]MDZ4151330.1 hypothetical protein [Methylicorpusculum sp.]
MKFFNQYFWGLFLCLIFCTPISAIRPIKKTNTATQLTPITEEEQPVTPTDAPTPSTQLPSDTQQTQQTNLSAYVFVGINNQWPYPVIARGLYVSVDREDKNISPQPPFTIDQKVLTKGLQRIEFNRFEQRGEKKQKNYFKLESVHCVDPKTNTIIYEIPGLAFAQDSFFYITLEKPTTPNIPRPTPQTIEGKQKPPRSPASPSMGGKHVTRKKRFSSSTSSSRTTSTESTESSPESDLSSLTPLFIMPPHSSGKKSVERPSHDTPTPTLPSQDKPNSNTDLTTLPEPPPGNVH